MRAYTIFFARINRAKILIPVEIPDSGIISVSRYKVE